MSDRVWNVEGESPALEWGGRSWEFDRRSGPPGLIVRGGTSAIGPLLALDGLAARGRLDESSLAGENAARVSAEPARVLLHFTPREWSGLSLEAIWRPVGPDALDLTIEARLASDAPGPVAGFEVLVRSTLPEPKGSRKRRWVEPRDIPAAAFSYDGREVDVSDLTTLPTPSGAAERLAPRLLPSPWDDGLRYVELARWSDTARRITESWKATSPGFTTRYGLVGLDLNPGEAVRATVRGVWLLSSSPPDEALDRASAFEEEGSRERPE